MKFVSNSIPLDCRIACSTIFNLSPRGKSDVDNIGVCVSRRGASKGTDLIRSRSEGETEEEPTPFQPCGHPFPVEGQGDRKESSPYAALPCPFTGKGLGKGVARLPVPFHVQNYSIFPTSAKVKRVFCADIS